ncbi:esterase FE4-like isoform X2 [Homalodisca vitripennis]|nr:esterase FE4-like isoform X2 [Homalodisca vitripennis]XP_046686740.1 esterase FE4-like isoform X2 [Homalodisca vitripennis]XP_046686741.1 esterase FE4-like isoform X2 [Homalodisca vitripennis]XP_046686742.1 esterase FE4-like isoform X2 [Homalodisca vitripennis]
MATSTLVNLKEGTIRGKVLTATSFSKKKYFAFQGIPYAQPPVGNLRFRDPQPPIPWQGIKDTVRESPPCPQKHILLQDTVGNEDNCLGLNVYTPDFSAAKPVMVWIHGGGFTFGSGHTDLHDPEYWMERDVVIVTCNYRVGALGFLSLGTSDVPGNAGLKDQVMVLRWVQRNIAQFGGDPGNVTLFGESAGGASVHYHLLSPMSKGLFHRAIIMSGSSLNSWAFSSEAVEKSRLLGEKMGCTSQDPQEVLQYLQTVPAFDLVKAQYKVVTAQDKQDIQVFPFTPSVETQEGEGERFLTDHPRSLLQKGQVAPVPLIVGVTDKEGMLVLNDIPHSDDYFKVLNNNFSRIVPGNLGLPTNGAEMIRQFFFGDKPMNWDIVPQYLDYYGDIFFYIGVDEMIKLHMACGVAPIYCYNITFDGQLGLLSWYLPQVYPQCDLRGVSHADDLGYIFKMNIPGPPEMSVGSPEEQVVKCITGLWYQFALSGNPNGGEAQTVVWEPVVKDQSGWKNYLELGKEPTMRHCRLLQQRMVFWERAMRPHSVLQQKL